MIALTDIELQDFSRQSSKGNQLKFNADGNWYKADYTGYEGLSEYLVSHLLEKTTLDASEYVLYDLEEIKYRNHIFNGTKSADFLEEDWQIITLERLFKLRYGKSLYQSVWKIPKADKAHIMV